MEKLKAEKENFALGRCEATLNLEYGNEGKIAKSSVVFWVFPWHLLLVSIIVFVILLLLLTLLIKKYNRWIVKKATKNNEIWADIN